MSATKIYMERVMQVIEVEVLINNFKDDENFNKVTKIKRNGIEIEIVGKLLQKGDIYSISKERYEVLSRKSIVAKVKKEKSE